MLTDFGSHDDVLFLAQAPGRYCSDAGQAEKNKRIEREHSDSGRGIAVAGTAISGYGRTHLISLASCPCETVHRSREPGRQSQTRQLANQNDSQGM